MSKSVATAFKSIHKCLIEETRTATIGLYRSLLKSSKSYPHSNILKSLIRDDFKLNKYNTSRPKVLELLDKAEKSRIFLEKGNAGDKRTRGQVNSYVNFYRKKIERRPAIPKKKSEAKKEKTLTKRKPYQVAITAYQSLGFQFKRVRGWRQPVKTAMMMKNRVKTNQARLGRYYRYTSELEMIKAERTFLQTLGCLPEDKLKDFETNIKLALSQHFEFYNNQKEKNTRIKKANE